MDNKTIQDARIAIVHDWAWAMRGGEAVLEVLCELFPKADLYMIFGDPKKLSPVIRERKICTTWLQKIPFIRKFYRYTYFLWPSAIEGFDFNGYDLVLTSSSCAAKGVITPYNVKQICYMHTPTRYAWDQSWEYFNPKNFSWWKRQVIPYFLNYLRIWDYTSSLRIDTLIVNSNTVWNRVEKYYKRKPDFSLNPPVDVDKFYSSDDREDYYLSVAPYEPNKGGRYLINAAIKYGFRLKLIGEGSMRKSLEKLAKKHKNIEFLGRVSNETKYELFSKARGFIMPGVEDFGITLLEALASGTPIVAYKKGGALDVVQDGVNGVLYSDQSEESLYGGIQNLEGLIEKKGVPRLEMRKYAGGFSRERFKAELMRIIEKSI